MKKIIQFVVIIGSIFWSIPFLSAQSITNQGCIGFGANPTNCGGSCENTITVCAGTAVTIKSCDLPSSNGGCSVAYCWFKDGSSTPLPGATGATLLQTGLGVATHTYVRQAHCGTCDFAGGGFTSAVTIVVVALPNAGVVSGSSPLCIGANTTYSSSGDAGGTWTSSNPAFASVNASTGVVTGVAQGTCNIIYTVTAACGTTASAQKSITISPNVTAGVVSGASPLCIGATATYTSNGTAGGAWSTSNPGIASVNAVSGVVTGVGQGSCDIIYTVTAGCGSPVSAQKSITINATVNAGTVSGATPICISATTPYASNGDAGGTWSSSNTSIATVNPSSGVVTGVGTGSCNIIYTITAGCGAPSSAQKAITISPNASAGNVAGNSPLCIGASTTYSSNGNPGGTWSSSNPAVATVDAGSGIVTGVSAGNCNIIYTVSAGCNAPTSAQRAITISPNANAGNVSGSSPLCVGATTTYTSSGNPGGTWSSSNTAFATVNPSNGIVTGVASGTCNIIYTVTTGCNAPTSAQQSITVIPNMTISLSSGPGSNIQTKCINTAITNITFTVGGSGTGANATNLPAGVSGSFSGGTFTISGTPVVAGVFNYTVTTTGSCTAATATGTITVVASPTVNSVTDRTFCPGTLNNIALSGTPAGVVLEWANTNTTIGLGPSGTGNISFTSTNGGTSPISGTITVTPKITVNSVTCSGNSDMFVITVNPTPIVDNVANQVVCNASQTNAINFNSSASGGTLEFTWTNNTPTIGLGGSGSGNIAPFTATNNGNAPVTATLALTPRFTNGGTTCAGSAKSFTITVNPTPKVNTVNNATYCTSNNATIAFSSPTTGGTVTYAWTNDNPAIGLLGNGNGPISFATTNSSTTPISGLISVTPSYTNAAVTCVGNPITFTITVNPVPVVNPVSNLIGCNAVVTKIDFSTPTSGGTVDFAWTNNNTGIGLGASGTGNISFLSANAGNGPINGAINVTPKITSNAVTCNGAVVNFTISINPTPKVNAVANQPVCNGATTNAVNFGTSNTGGTVSYAWTNNNPSIGLGSNGTGNIPAFLASNSNDSPSTGRIDVVPSYTNTNGGPTCDGASTNLFSYIVNPTPKVNDVVSLIVCVSTSTNVPFSSPTTGGTMEFAWTNNNIAIGLGASGSGTLNFSSTNGGNGPISGNVVVTPKFTNIITCTGSTMSFSITVNPLPKVTPTAPQVFCNGDPSSGFNFSSPNTGGTLEFTWTNNNTAIGLGASGTGNIPGFTANNSTFATISATINVTPKFTNTNGPPTCNGAASTFTITVHPSPQVNNISLGAFCPNETVNLNFSSNPTGSTFAWTNNNTLVGLNGSGNGTISFKSAANDGAGNIDATVAVTPTSDKGCKGPVKEFSLVLKPTPQLVQLPLFTECSLLPFILPTFAINPVVSGAQNYVWSNNGVPGLGSNGTGQIGTFTPPANTTGGNITGKITYTVTVLGCPSISKNFDVVVFPQPQLSLNLIENSGATPNDGIVCETDQVSIQSAATNSPSPYAFLWNNGSTAPLLVDNPAGPNSGSATKAYTLTVTDNNGCKNFGSRTITINKYPKVDISFVENSGVAADDGKICSKDLLALTANESNGSNNNYSFDWNVNNSKSKSVTLNPVTTGKQTFVVTVTNSGCKKTDNQEIDIIGLPRPSIFKSNAQIPVLEAAKFTDISSVSVNNNPIQQWFWTFQDGVPADTTVFQSSKTVSTKFLNFNPNNKLVCLKVTDNANCKADTCINQTVINSSCDMFFDPIVPTCFSDLDFGNKNFTFKISKTGVFADGMTTNLTVSGPGITGQQKIASTQLDGKGVISNQPYTFLPTQPGTYKLTLSSRSNNPDKTCDFDKTVDVIILPSPEGKIKVNKTAICFGDTVQLQLDLKGGTLDVQYLLNGILKTAKANTLLNEVLAPNTHFTKPPTNNPVKYIYTIKSLVDSLGCKAKEITKDIIASDSLILNPLPSFGIDTAKCLPGNNQFYLSFAIKNGKAPYSFVSDSITKGKVLFGGITGTQFVSDTLLSKDGGNNYYIKIIDALGCKDSVKSSVDCKGSCSVLPGIFKSDTIKKCNLDNNPIVIDFATPASGVVNGANYFILVKENNLTLNTLIVNKNLILWIWKGAVNLNDIKTKINIGELYYIYEIYGSDSTAVKNLTDACLRITNVPKPIIFNNLPTIQTIKFAKDKICDGEEVDLNIKFTGAVPITFLLNNKQTTFSSLTDKVKYGKSGDGYGNATTFEPKITNLEDKNGCKVDQPLNNFDKLTINPLPLITAMSDLTFCKNKKNDVITVTHNTIPNRSYQYKWTFPDTTNIRIKNQTTKTITIDLLNDNVKGIPFNVEVKDGTTGCIDTMNAVVNINDGASAPEIDTILKVKGNKTLDSYVMIYPDFSLCYEWQVDTTGTGDFSPAKNCYDGNSLAYCEYQKELLGNNTKFQVKIWKKDGSNCDKNKACSNIATVVREGDLGGGIAEPLQLILHPNPNEGDFSLTLAGGLAGNYRVTIIDNVGRVVHRGMFTKTTYESKIDMNHQNLANGIYFLQLRDQEGNYFNLKFIVQH